MWATRRAIAGKGAELAFAVAVHMFPMDHFAMVTLHKLQGHASAEDETDLKEILLKSQDTVERGTAWLEIGDVKISATISVEMIRGQRVLVLDVGMEQQSDLAADSHFYASYLRSRPDSHLRPALLQTSEAASSEPTETDRPLLRSNEQ